ncbi:Type 1 glutamine amidotransferase-like domain-containing protein [Nonomuraea sp. B12E4]|uniref:Type 1 glutamine amidotransferase-like domain-containing protein n=1 Tax=Nonomuraea sp. B12E4 TaxID=3153564 RepID=UPI00325F1F37
MRKVFLGSAGLGALPPWLASLPLTARHAVLVPTAANPLPAAPWVEAADSLLRGEGMVVERLDLERAGAADVERALRGADLVFVAGGYPLFLLEHVQRTGFDRVVAPAVREGRLGYADVSAGAALAAPDLGYYREADAAIDPGDPGAPESTRGLGLVPFLVLAHRNRGRAERHDRQVARHGEQAYLSINDDQAVVVHGGTWKVRASP